MDEGGAAKYPRAALRVGPEDLGRRVTLRRRVSGGFSDTIGELLSFSAEALVVRRASGETVRLATDEIVAGRVVVPR